MIYIVTAHFIFTILLFAGVKYGNYKSKERMAEYDKENKKIKKEAKAYREQVLSLLKEIRACNQ